MNVSHEIVGTFRYFLASVKVQKMFSHRCVRIFVSIFIAQSTDVFYRLKILFGNMEFLVISITAIDRLCVIFVLINL